MKNVYTFDNLKWDYESLLEFKKEFNPDFDDYKRHYLA